MYTKFAHIFLELYILISKVVYEKCYQALHCIPRVREEKTDHNSCMNFPDAVTNKHFRRE